MFNNSTPFTMPVAPAYATNNGGFGGFGGFPVFTGLFGYHHFSLVCGFGGFGFHQNHR